MAMTDSFDPGPLDPGRLGGHTVEELSDYLDRDRTPADPTIEDSPECRLALDAMTRLRTLARALIEDDARRDRAGDDAWVRGILAGLGREVEAGRSIPLAHPGPGVELGLTEGSVRGVVRAAGDSVGGVLIGRCELDGDVTVPGAPVTVRIWATAFWGHPLPELAGRVRAAVAAALARHTELSVAAVDVTIEDLQRLPSTRTGT